MFRELSIVDALPKLIVLRRSCHGMGPLAEGGPQPPYVFGAGAR